MSSLPKVALIGATGNLGAPILQQLLDAGFSVTILTRQGSTSTANLPSHPNQIIKEVDYTSTEALAQAFKGHDVVVSTVGSANIGTQDKLVEAAIASGTVTRFIPSDFGSDIYHPKNIDLPVYKAKLAINKYLQDAAAAHPHFTFTCIMNNAFLDWGMEAGFLINPKAHTATLWDGGDRSFSATRLSTVAGAVVKVLKNLPATANKHLRIHDRAVTQNQLIDIAKKIDGKEWTTTPGNTKEAEAEAYAELQKPQPDYTKAMVGFLVPAIYGEGRDVYASQVDNKMLGIPEMNDAELEETVRKVL